MRALDRSVEEARQSSVSLRLPPNAIPDLTPQPETAAPLVGAGGLKVSGNRIIAPMNTDAAAGNTVQVWIVVNGVNTYQTISTP